MRMATPVSWQKKFLWMVTQVSPDKKTVMFKPWPLAVDVNWHDSTVTKINHQGDQEAAVGIQPT